jgi:hypothetical protein
LSGRDEEHISALQRNRGKREFCDGLAKLQGVLAARCNLQQVHGVDQQRAEPLYVNEIRIFSSQTPCDMRLLSPRLHRAEAFQNGPPLILPTHPNFVHRGARAMARMSVLRVIAVLIAAISSAAMAVAQDGSAPKPARRM